MDRLSTSLIALFSGLAASDTETVAMPAWQRHFEARGAKGTFVLFEPARERYRVFDSARAERRYLPAATYEIACALMGLEEGLIADEKQVFAWDGTLKPVPAWERDQTLASALRDGTTWVFQEVARRAGRVCVRDWLERLEFGNADISGGVDLFWLRGGLRVSAMEQVRFLHRLAEGRLPVTQRAQRIVRDALVTDKARERTVFAKAGATGGRDAVQWRVGWIERRGRVEAVYAMNLAPGPRTAYGDRLEIANAILREAGVLPSGSRPA